MTPEEQNSAIALAIGEIYHKPTEDEIKAGSYYQYEPNFCGDLNAMHHAEKNLSHSQTGIYQECLGNVVGAKSIFNIDLIRATASQRAEAFLKTVGKWKETP